MIIRRLRRRLDDDSGAFAILFGVVMVAVVGMGSIAVDLGSLQMDRETDRAASDAAVTSGAAVLSTTGPQAACLTAASYALTNLNLVGVPTCVGFPTTLTPCPASTVESALTISQITVKVRWPILDSDPAMTNPDIRPGTAVQGITGSDGAACGRIGVSITRPRHFNLAGIFGASTGTTTSTSIALATTRNPGAALAPLVALDPNSCNALNVNGGAHLMINHAAVADPVTGKYDPGRIIVDSDGAGGDVGCNGNVTTIDASNNSWIRAQDGLNADGSAGALATISSYAVTKGNSDAYKVSDTAGCVHGTTTVSGNLCPVPIGPVAPVGQTAFNNLYNCQLSNGCTAGSGTSKAYIDQFASFATTAPYTVYSSCTSSGALPTVITGNVVVNCPGGFTVKNTTVFTGGTVIFKGGVSLSGAGSCLLFGVPALLGTAVTCATPAVSLALYSANPETEVYISGGLAVPSNTTLVAPQTFMMIRGLYNVGGTSYQSAPFGKSLTGTACSAGTSSVPPTVSCFANLAIWDDFDTSAQSHNLSGGGSFHAEGAMYFPLGEFVFTGNSSGVATSAQFVANRITVTGGGQLTLTPTPSRQVAFTINTGGLIR